MRTLVLFIKSEDQEDSLLEIICDHFKRFFSDRCDVFCFEYLNYKIAEIISKYDQVIFINTSNNFHLGNFFWKSIKPADHFINTSFKKQIDPLVFLSFTRYIFGFAPKGYMCVIGTSSSSLKFDIEIMKRKLFSEIEEFLEEKLIYAV